jgi:hypothetical protein
VIELPHHHLLRDHVPARPGAREPVVEPLLLLGFEHRHGRVERLRAAGELAVAARLVRAVLALVDHAEVR